MSEVVDSTAQSKCQKMKSSGPFVVTICFALSVIVMIFLTPTIIFDGRYNLDYRYCKEGSHQFNITVKDITCIGWFEFRYLNLLDYFPMYSNTYTQSSSDSKNLQT